MKFSSRLIEEAVEEFAKFPGIGRKSALRHVLFLLKQEIHVTHRFTQALNNLREHIQYCKRCHNVSDEPICEICKNPLRDTSTICVVEQITDLIAIENTHQYNGLFHVLGGVISPIDGISPEKLHINTLIERIKTEPIREVILALNSKMESETTAFYITKKLKDLSIPNLKITTIARGVPIGSELEYTDEVTLGRSILARTIYE
ncbi:MAG: recombination mediator RecR [Cytophagales bacterium]|nr:recombination mediator RecR [Cytophagales bacterium]MDW8383456.1 recombination mediator RecR [Flammeovirgaceae bacterium]